jgi:aminoglycoside phosphotransferase (APT) family kinase protein
VIDQRDTVATNPAPVTQEIALSPRWLTSALQTVFPGVEVVGSKVVEVLRTVATKIRFTVDLAPDSAPMTTVAFCVKAYFDRAEQGYRGGETEGAFYRELAAGLPVRTPTAAYVGADPENGHTLVIMHDLTAEGAAFLTALTPYSADQTVATLDQLAHLHASHWNDPALRSIEWLVSRVARIPDSFPVDLLQSQLDTRRGDPLPPEIRDAARLDAAMRTLARSDPDARASACIVHGDAHAGNVFVAADGGPGLIDWQIAHRGCWALDVAYHIGAVLDVDERRRSERDLLGRYLDQLGRAGADAPSWDDAWELYRRYMVYGYYLWAITRFVQEDITVEFVKRLGTAVADHQSFDLCV